MYQFIRVLTTFFNTTAYGHISITSIVAIVLFGQSLIAVPIDHFGLFGMKRQPFQINSLWGFSISFTGIACMFDRTAAISIPASADTAFRPWIYFGGILVVSIVLLYNLTAPKAATFKPSFLTFIGQISAGILLDLISGNIPFNSSFIGGTAISSGIAVNMILKKLELYKTEKRQKYWSEIKRMEDAHRAHLIEIYQNEKNNRL